MAQVLFVTGKNVLLPGNDIPQPATLKIDVGSGKITDIQYKHIVGSNFASELPIKWIDAGDRFILPGLVEWVQLLFAHPFPLSPRSCSAHVHLNEPGRTDWEGFWTGTRAAISGGVTTLVDMPLNSIPPTTTTDHLEIKRQAARGQCWTDVAFWGGIIPDNQVGIFFRV